LALWEGDCIVGERPDEAKPAFTMAFDWIVDGTCLHNRPCPKANLLMKYLLLFLCISCAFAGEPPQPRNGSLLLAVNDDGFSAFHSGRYQSAEDLRQAMLAYKDTQVAIMEWCVIAGSRANYPSKVTELIGEGMTEFPRRGDHLAHTTFKRMARKHLENRRRRLSRGRARLLRLPAHEWRLR